MSNTKLLLAAVLLLALPVTSSFAQDATTTTGTTVAGSHDSWKSLTPEQRQAKREAMKQKWQNATPEQKTQFKERMQKRKSQHMNPQTGEGNQQDSSQGNE